MPLCLSACLSVYVCLYMFVCLSLSMSLSLCLCHTIYLTVYLNACLYVCMSLSVSVYVFVALSLHLLGLSVCLPACLPVCLPVSRAFPVSTMKINEGRLFRSQTTTDHAHNPTDRCTHIQKHTQPDLNGHQDISANHVLRVVHTSRVSLHSITNY